MHSALTRPMRIIAVFVTAIAALMATTATVARADDPPPVPFYPHPPLCFGAYDFTGYSNIDIADETSIIEASTITFWKWPDAHKNVTLPPEREFKDYVKSQLTYALYMDGEPGPIVLDYENYLNSSITLAEAQRRKNLFITMLTWMREALVEAGDFNHIIGAYGLAWPTAPQYIPLVTEIMAHADAFFESDYMFSSSQSEWLNRLNQNISKATQINPNKPILSYIWPQHDYRSPTPYAYVDAAFWTYQLQQVHSKVDGFVLWSAHGTPGPVATNLVWANATKSFMNSITDEC